MLRIATLVVIAMLVVGCRAAPASTPDSQGPPATKALTNLSETARRQIYWDLVVAQDKGVGDEEAYTVVARQHGVSVETVRKIAAEGSSKLWPIPTAPK